MLTITCSLAQSPPSSVVIEGKLGAGRGRHVVLIAGDEEYRSEETLPQLAKILAVHHGFACTVIFPVDADGTINPNARTACYGLEALKSADLMVIFLRWRDLPDEQMKHIVDYVESGRPIVALRTSTHAFRIPAGKAYSRWSYDSKEWDGGFGRQVLGETWISHHGAHGKQSTRGVLVKEQAAHPILRGLRDGDLWGPTDVYGLRLPLPGDSMPLVLGQVLEGMLPTDKPVEGKPNDPMMPIAWTKTWQAPNGKTARVFTTTMGASQDFASLGLRRLLVNACYWALGMERRIPSESKVDFVGEFKPSPFRNNGFIPGVKPGDHALK